MYKYNRKPPASTGREIQAKTHAALSPPPLEWFIMSSVRSTCACWGFWAQGAGQLGEAGVLRWGEPRAESGCAAKPVGPGNAPRSQRKPVNRQAAAVVSASAPSRKAGRLLPLSDAEASRRFHHPNGDAGSGRAARASPDMEVHQAVLPASDEPV